MRSRLLTCFCDSDFTCGHAAPAFPPEDRLPELELETRLRGWDGWWVGTWISKSGLALFWWVGMFFLSLILDAYLAYLCTDFVHFWKQSTVDRVRVLLRALKQSSGRPQLSSSQYPALERIEFWLMTLNSPGMDLRHYIVPTEGPLMWKDSKFFLRGARRERCQGVELKTLLWHSRCWVEGS